MNATAASPPQSSISDFLRRASEHVGGERFGEALKLVLAAKAVEPRNIYLIAVEKQLTRLADGAKNGTLTKTEKNEILGQLPNLFERALGAGQRQGGPMDSARSALTQSQTQSGAKQEKLQALKSQYFERADEFLERGDYQSALGEVRRVLIIDPENSVAKKYEEKIRQLATLQAKNSGHPEETKAPESSTARPAESGRVKVSESGRARVSESGRMKISESGKAKITDSGKMKISDSGTHGGGHTSSEDRHGRATVPSLMPTDAAVAAAPMVGKDEADHEAGKSKTGLILGLVAVVVVALGVAVFMMMRGTSSSPNSSMAAKTETTQQPNESAASTTTPATENQSASMPAVTSSAASPNASASKNATKSEEKKSSTEAKPAPAKPTQTSEASTKTAPTQSAPASTPPPQQTAPATAQPAAQAPATQQQADQSNEQSFVPVEREPQIVKREIPKFNPAFSKGAGKIIAKVQIDPQGRPIKAVIVSSFNTALNDAVIEAVMNSKYSPGMMTNGPVTSWLTIPFVFQ